jgi:catechol 2,3-dioxygenase-like lactoylglutathione lyase family enzyme
LDFKYEVTVVPVSDVDRAKDFYAEKLGFNVDVDHRAGEDFRVVQLTPPGSAASISIGTGIPGSPWVVGGTYRFVLRRLEGRWRIVALTLDTRWETGDSAVLERGASPARA